MKKAFTLLLAMLVLMTVAVTVPALAAEVDWSAETGAGWRTNKDTDWESVWAPREGMEDGTAKDGEKFVYMTAGVVYAPRIADLKPLCKYIVGVWYKGDGRVVLRENEAEKLTDVNLETAADWTYTEVEMISTEAADFGDIELRIKTNGTYAAYDAISVRESTNLLANGNFDGSEMKWTKQSESADISVADNVSGANGKCLKITGAQGVYVKQTAVVSEGKAYRLSFRARVNDTKAQIRVQAGDRHNNAAPDYYGTYFNQTVSAADTWYTFTFYFTAKAVSGSGFNVYLRGDEDGDTLFTVHYDDVVLEEVGDSIAFYSSDMIKSGSGGNGYIYPLYINTTEELTALPVAGGDIYTHFRLNSEDASFLGVTCVYEHTGDKIKIYDIAVECGTVEPEGQNVTATDAYYLTTKVTVPEKTAEKSYTVKSFMWNSASRLTPYITAAVLQ